MLLTPFYVLPLFAAAVSSSLTPDQAIQYALAENLELRAARYQIAVAEAELKWAGRLNDPELEVAAATDEWGLNENEGLIEVALSQEFPITKRLKHERNLSEIDLALAKAEVRTQEWHLADEVRRRALEVQALRRQVQLHEELRSVLADLAANMQAAYARAEASQLDVTETKLEVQIQERAIRQSQNELNLATSELRTLLGLPATAPLHIAGSLMPPSDRCHVNITQQVVASRPDLQLRILQERRAEAAIALAKSQQWQDIAVRFFMEREIAEDAPEGIERNTFLGVGLSMPLPLRTPKARLTEAPTHKLEAAQASTLALSVAVENEIAAANAEVASRRRIWQEAGGETLELARSHVDQVKEAWATGKASYTRLQRSQERALSIEENAIEALLEYHRACARLRKAAAQDLPDTD